MSARVYAQANEYEERARVYAQANEYIFNSLTAVRAAHCLREGGLTGRTPLRCYSIQIVRDYGRANGKG